MRYRLIVALAACLCVLPLAGRRNKTTAPRYAEHAEAKAVNVAGLDTVTAGMDTLIAISDYAKPLRSRLETFNVCNRSCGDLSVITLTFRYVDVGTGREFHARTLRIPVSIPSGASRQVEVRSFDRQEQYRYRLSPKPRGWSGREYEVVLTADTLFYFPKS